VTDGAVLPILHLNGYKIASPTILARMSDKELESLFIGYGYKPYVVEGSAPAVMHQMMVATLDAVMAEIRAIQQQAHRQHQSATNGYPQRPSWPMIILRTPKGWTGPKEVDGQKTEGSWRSHQVPLAEMASKPEHVKLLEDWMKSYRPEELFDASGTLIPELQELAPKGVRRMGANPHANGGLLLRALKMPEFRDYAVEVPQAGDRGGGSDPGPGTLPARCDDMQSRQPEFSRHGSRRTDVEPARRPARNHQPRLDGRHESGGRLPSSRWTSDGDPQ
jgi:xylulose-5-phosphate/fructose-6-phosphate phosphoketolase